MALLHLLPLLYGLLMDLLVNYALVVLPGVLHLPCRLLVSTAPLGMRHGAVLAVKADAGGLHTDAFLLLLEE